MNSSEIGRRCGALNVIDAREDGRGQREDRPVAPRTAERQLRDGREKQQNGDHLSGNGSEVQPRSLPQNQAQLQKGRYGEADPADQPKAKITAGLITSKKKKQDQQDNERCNLEEVDGQQALILQHYVPPPGCRLGARSQTKMRRSQRNRSKRLRRAYPSTLTRCFLTGQQRRIPVCRPL